MSSKHQSTRIILLSAILAILLILSGYLYYQITLRDSNIESLTSQKETHLQRLSEASTTISILSSELSLTEEELSLLEDDYRFEKSKNDEFEDQIRDIAGTVGDLDKLAKIDEELLQKYSKVYFLNEHYIPEKTKAIEKTYLYHEDEPEYLHTSVMSFFNNMVRRALRDDVNLWVISAFRSFDEQAALKGGYTVTYGSGANTFSADQGYSEHQLGTTIDFTTRGISGGFTGFEDTEAYEWLTDNAHRYGFVLSYPEGNAFYVFEPWHWRFIGTGLARKLYRDGQIFYNLDQREIDEHLIDIFD